MTSHAVYPSQLYYVFHYWIHVIASATQKSYQRTDKYIRFTAVAALWALDDDALDSWREMLFSTVRLMSLHILYDDRLFWCFALIYCQRQKKSARRLGAARRRHESPTMIYTALERIMRAITIAYYALTPAGCRSTHWRPQPMKSIFNNAVKQMRRDDLYSILYEFSAEKWKYT